jgi:NAD(P)-dependent dehydrogenase (short-subunit alcohol dehydrogenase family)
MDLVFQKEDSAHLFRGVALAGDFVLAPGSNRAKGNGERAGLLVSANSGEDTMGRLEGKTAIVTGAASGIGRASARLFAREGARVLAVDREPAALDETVASIRMEGGTALAHPADVAAETAVKAYVARAIEAFGGLDAIYANAGISGGLVPLFEQSVEHWMEVLRVNLIGPFLAIKHAAPEMIARGKGSIVLTASVAGLRANAGGNPYSASKAGVISLAQTSANSLIGTGVRVNAICPGLIETGMTRPIFEGARARGTEGKIGQLNPLQRAGAPEEIAAMALFLASDEASYVNGQAFPVDGGLSSTHPFTGPRR